MYRFSKLCSPAHLDRWHYFCEPIHQKTLLTTQTSLPLHLLNMKNLIWKYENHSSQTYKQSSDPLLSQMKKHPFSVISFCSLFYLNRKTITQNQKFSPWITTLDQHLHSFFSSFQWLLPNVLVVIHIRSIDENCVTTMCSGFLLL